MEVLLQEVKTTVMSIEVPIIIASIVLILFFVVRIILKRYSNNSQHLNWKAFGISVFLAPFVYLALIYAFFSYIFYEPQYDFDKEQWFADIHSRHEMKDDLVDSKILEGMSKSEIIKTIGESENNDSIEVWTYDLGMSGAGFGVQFNYLKLTFENDLVSKVEKIEIID